MQEIMRLRPCAVIAVIVAKRRFLALALGIKGAAPISNTRPTLFAQGGFR